MDHLAQEPGAGVRSADRRQDLGPEAGRYRVRRVEPPSRRAPVQPVAHDLGDVVQDRGLLVVQDDELVMPLERGEVPAGRIAAEPLGGRRARAAAQRRLERRERTADVIEHPVQDDPQAPAARLGDQVVEVLLVPQPGVDLEVVNGVVPVGLGGEHRSEQQARATELDGIVQPPRQLPQPVPDGLLGRRLGLLGSGEAQRVHVPEDGMLGPRRHPSTIAAAGPIPLPSGSSAWSRSARAGSRAGR
jgi:hypothetical protein